MKTVTVNNRKFSARNTPQGVLLYHPGGELFAFVKRGTVKENPFIVTALQTPEGVRYMFSTCSITNKILGLNKLNYSSQIDLAQNIIDQVRVIPSLTD